MSNKTMGDILDEAGYTREEIIEYVSVIDEKTYMEYDKQGESFNIDDFPNSEVKTIDRNPSLFIEYFLSYL